MSASPGASHTALTAMSCNRLYIHPLSDDDRRGLISKTMKEASKHLTVCLALNIIAFLILSERLSGKFVIIKGAARPDHFFSPLGGAYGADSRQRTLAEPSISHAASARIDPVWTI